MIVSSYSDITIQFPIRNNAEITKQVLEVDPELSPDKVDKVFEDCMNLENTFYQNYRKYSKGQKVKAIHLKIE